MFSGELATLHCHTGITHQRLGTKADTHFSAAIVELLKKRLWIYARKVILPEDTFRGRVRMDFEWQPFINDCKFLFQFFDNTFADVTKGSDVVGIDSDLNWSHWTSFFTDNSMDNQAIRSIFYFLGHRLVAGSKILYMIDTIIYIVV